MSIPFRLVVFDCDGTLVDSQHGIIATMQAAFADADLTAPVPEAVRRVVGLSLETAVLRLLIGDSEASEAEWDQAKAVADRYRHHFHVLRDAPDFDEPLFPGTQDVLRGLDAAGVMMGVATGKGMRGLKVVLEKHGLAGHFVTLQTADGNPGKPHPEMLRRAMAETGAAADETLLVGDTVFDVEMARNAGVRAVGVSWGYHPVADLETAGAARVIDHFDKLLPALVEL